MENSNSRTARAEVGGIGKLLLGASLFAFFGFGAQGALAQTADQKATTQSTDIIVTAQFQSQRLQDTPLAITATTGALMEARGQSNVTDFAAHVPSLYIQTGGSNNGPSATVALRGIGQSDPTLALEPGVGMYIDDVYYSTVVGSNFDLLDLDRIEVLRGPQGTLAGKNSLGGAIKLYSKRPGPSANQFLQATYGSYDRAEVLGAVNLPLIEDTLYARISGAGRHSDGYIKRIDYGCAFPGSGVPPAGGDASCVLGRQGGTDSMALRGALRWLASDRLEANFIGDFASNKDEPAPALLIYADRAGNGLPPLIEGGVALDDRFVAPDFKTTYGTYGYNGLNFGYKNNRRVWGVSGDIEFALTDNLSLKSITAYRKQRIEYNDDPDQSPLSMGLTDSTITQRQFTQEVRLSGQISEMLDFTVGGFYFDSNGLQSGRTEFFPLSFLFADRAKTKSKSAFGHAIFHLTSQIDLTGGIRYTDDKRTYSFYRANPNGGPALFVGLIDGLTDTYNADRFDYRANISYRPADALMLYAQYSTGFKGGGSNPRPVFPNQFVGFGPETLDTYEVGAKFDLFDNRARLNVAAFHNDYSGIQLSTSAPFFNPDLPVQPNPFLPNYNPIGGTAPAFVFQNGGNGRTRGVEVEGAVTPFEGMSVDASVSYLDFKYKSLTAAAIASGVLPGYKTPYTPEWKWSLGAQYEIDLASSGTFIPRIDVSYQSSTFAYPANSAINKLAQRTLVNGRLTYRASSGDWEAALSVSNLTNEHYYTSVFDISAASGVATAGVGRPREWAISVKRNF